MVVLFILSFHFSIAYLPGDQLLERLFWGPTEPQVEWEQPEPPLPVCAKVVDHAGQPVFDATVKLYGLKDRPKYPLFPYDLVLLEQTQTDINGAFCIN